MKEKRARREKKRKNGRRREGGIKGKEALSFNVLTATAVDK